VNKERALQVAERAELAAREAEYERAFDEVGVVAGHASNLWPACRERGYVSSCVGASRQSAVPCMRVRSCSYAAARSREAAEWYALEWKGGANTARVRTSSFIACRQVLMHADAEGLKARQEADTARRAAGRMGMKAIEQQMQVRWMASAGAASKAVPPPGQQNTQRPG
jgi:hypothetical protein